MAVCVLGGGVVGWAAHGAWLEYLANEARKIPPAGPDQPVEPFPEPEPQPEPEPEPEATPAPSAALPQVGEAFVERFDRDSITDRWSVSDGWSNGEWMSNDWRESSLSVEPGMMTISMQPGPEGSDKELASAEVQTHDRRRYGYFETRMQVPRDAGLVTGFFSYAGRNGRTAPNEIDIEIIGRNTRIAELTIHQGGKATSKKVALPFDAAAGLHTYGFDWQPGHVRWYADGKMIHQETGAAARKLTQPQQLILHLWASKELHAWVGKLDMARAPWRLEVACVAYAPTYSGPICK